MDNLTHSLVGWTLGQAGLKTRTRKGLAALILGANMPDIDVFFGWVPWEPLATHRGFTHGLIGGVLLMPPILAALLWLLDRLQVHRKAYFASGLEMHFGWLVALSYLGALTHPLLDWQTSYAIQLLSPFDDRWFHTDALFIIDVWILIGLGAAIALSKRREGLEQANWRTPAVVALSVLLAYVSLNAGISALARKAVTAGPPHAHPEVIVAGPPPALFWRRELIWREHGALARGSYDPLRSMRALQSHTSPVPDGMDDPLVPLAMGKTREAVRFMRWSILPMARVTRERCEATVRFNDARFADGLARERFWLSVVVPTGSRGC